jgi:hypothetical protein
MMLDRSAVCSHHKTKIEERNENYAGSKTLPASIKEKETHWPEVP